MLTTATPFTVYMPRVQARKTWERMRKDKIRAPQLLGPPLAFCKRCSVGVGARYVQRELYLVPTVRLLKRRPPELRWTRLCGLCALEDEHLSFGYCLVAEADWEHHPLFDLVAIEAAKIAQLTAFLLDAWPTEPYTTAEEFNSYLYQLRPPVATAAELDTTLAA